MVFPLERDYPPSNQWIESNEQEAAQAYAAWTAGQAAVKR